MEEKIKKKKDCFEYIVSKLLEWNKEQKGDQMNFTKLKLQKLLFLISAIKADSQNKGLLDIFDSFYAMQYGPVESDIYNAMVNNQFSNFSFENREIKYNSTHNTILDKTEQKMIDRAIQSLKEKNIKLVLCSASELVDITHKWKSWKYAMVVANAMGKGSEKMNVDNICNDEKFFQ